MDAAIIPDLADALVSKDPVKRYWEAVGLLVLDEKFATAEDAVLPLLKDTSPVIRTVAGEALFRWGKKDVASEALVANVTTEMDTFSLLHLLNTLRRLDLLDQLPKDWTKGKTMTQDGQDYIKRFSARMN